LIYKCVGTHLISEKFVVFVAGTQQVWVEWQSFTRCRQWVGKTA